MRLNSENFQKIVEIAVKTIKKGGVIICPTDTVYGLVCDAGNEKAVKKIFEMKKRDESKPLPVFVKNIEQAKKLAFVNKAQENFLKDSKITTILKARKSILSPLVYKDKTIGIRIPKYELLNLILEKFSKPVAQTSANISSKEATTKIKEVLEQFEGQNVIIIDEGNLPENKPSKIIDLTKNNIKIIRK